MTRATVVSPGDVFGRLTILNEAGKKGRERTFLVRCYCGTTKIVQLHNMRSGKSATCGCGQRIVKHGQWRSPTYSSWAKMTDRCTSFDPRSYENYMGRGISIDPRWRQFENFLDDMGERPPGLTLERIDNDGHYTKKNCRWASRAEQQRNRRNNQFVMVNDKRLCLTDASRLIGVSCPTIRSRARRHNISFQAALDFYVARQLLAGVTSTQHP